MMYYHTNVSPRHWAGRVWKAHSVLFRPETFVTDSEPILEKASFDLLFKLSPVRTFSLVVIHWFYWRCLNRDLVTSLSTVVRSGSYALNALLRNPSSVYYFIILFNKHPHSQVRCESHLVSPISYFISHRISSQPSMILWKGPGHDNVLPRRP